MKTIAIVPARAGSKGLPDKNVKMIGERSLLELAVMVGRDCDAVDAVYISTDSADYEKQALAAGARSLGLRGKHLSEDKARSVDVVLDLIGRLPVKPDNVVLLQPTAPVRTPTDIEHALALLDANTDAAVSVCLLGEPHPEKLKSIDDDGLLTPYLAGSSSEIPRQELPPVYQLNGAIYAIRVSALEQHRSFFPPRTRPLILACGVNIDAHTDLMLLRLLWQQGQTTIHGLEQ